MPLSLKQEFVLEANGQTLVLTRDEAIELLAALKDEFETDDLPIRKAVAAPVYTESAPNPVPPVNGIPLDPARPKRTYNRFSFKPDPDGPEPHTGPLDLDEVKRFLKGKGQRFVNIARHFNTTPENVKERLMYPGTDFYQVHAGWIKVKEHLENPALSEARKNLFLD